MNSNSDIKRRIECVDLSTMRGDIRVIENTRQIGTLMEIHPWIATFKQMCFTNQFNVSSLNNLMTYCIRNVRSNVNECQTKPQRADKLRSFISETLLFFLYYYKVQEEKYDDTVYMNLMSDLLATYIDTELKASKRSNECHERISGRIASYLWIYLGNSAEYILDTFFKVRFMSSNYHQILHPVISKIFTLIPEQPHSSLMYVRYFLIYRIWKRITKCQIVKNEINSKAMASLYSLPTSFPQHIMDNVLPKVPNNHTITARYLLQQPIELEKSCESFVQFCRQSTDTRCSPNSENNQSKDVCKTSKLEDKTPCKLLLPFNENSRKNNSLSIVDTNKKINIELNSAKSINSKLLRKPLTKKISKSPGNVVLIDLTSDDPSDKIMKRKTKVYQKRLLWIRSLLKRDSNVAAAAATNEDTNVTKDFQRLEDTLENQSQFVTTNDSDWIMGLGLSPSEMKELSIQSHGDESQIKNEEFTNIIDDQSYDDLIEDFSTTHIIASDDMSKSKNFDTDNLENEMKDITFQNTDEMLIENKPQSPIHIEEVQVEITTTDVINVTNESEQNIDSTIDTKYSVELTPPPSDSSVTEESISSAEVPSKHIFSTLTGPMRDTVLQINESVSSVVSNQNELDLSKIHDADLHENIDGLSLLASVSQRVSHLTTSPESTNKSKEVIKVKDYSTLINNNDKIENNESKELYENHQIDISNDVNILSDGDIDKVALHVDVTSSENIIDTSYIRTIHKQEHMSNYCVPNNEQLNALPVSSVQMDSSIQSDKDDTNVILNGETIVLLQKSPNSNLYIINKAAIESKEINNDGDEDCNSVEKDQTIEKVNDELYQYEIYDSIYRMGQSTPSKTSFELTQNVNDGARTTAMDFKISGMKKNNKEVMSPRRRRVKQEFNGCNSSTCQDLVDAHSIHIPSSTSLYHSNYSTGDLFISCRQNYNSVACGMSVNHSTAPMHSHSKSSRCSCLNCAYGIVAHCGQCILPTGEAGTSSEMDNNYYIPMQKSTIVQNCSLTKSCNDENVDIYDKKLLCKIETIDDENSTEIYRSETNRNLPLKKRFKSMPVDYTGTSIKRGKIVNNYPSTPMMSIAAIEADKKTDISSQLITHQVDSKEMIRNNFESELLNGYHNYKNVVTNTSDDSGNSSKRKRTGSMEYPLDNSSGESERLSEQLPRPSKKVKEQKSSAKKTARRTRSSQRQVPKINYSYMDIDHEWNPSGETKRKRKKSSR